MGEKKLHPNVQKFKEFIREHPLMIKEVRKGNYTWQELYEEWYLLGEDDPKWKAYTSTNPLEKHSRGNGDETSAFFQQLVKTLKNTDMEKLQGYIQNLNETIQTIQGILSELQRAQKEGKGNSTIERQKQNPFSFRRD
ncbi:YlbD family protein [Fervidibacillus halotolerans]|uniref:YlbD family protein n=1 Tax=Fervidibacillus halotolerans TaxID=2980027 RepID=A0A9E8M281_9BACI|nr:YlbD family protein [Fervidibacillus halotolerans]WAA13911.1 YlbD family protein [Fervidibacillus halotolerans]